MVTNKEDLHICTRKRARSYAACRCRSRFSLFCGFRSRFLALFSAFCRSFLLNLFFSPLSDIRTRQVAHCIPSVHLWQPRTSYIDRTFLRLVLSSVLHRLRFARSLLMPRHPVPAWTGRDPIVASSVKPLTQLVLPFFISLPSFSALFSPL